MMPSLSFCLLLSLFLPISVPLQTLVPTPVQFQNSIVQCGCNNRALTVLTPQEGAGGDANVTEIVLTGFFSFNNASESSKCSGLGSRASITGHLVPAAIVALDEINSSPNILPNYHLTLDPRDTRGCDVLQATTQYIESTAGRIRGNTRANSFNLGVVGAGCQAVTETVAGISEKSLHLPVVSYGLDHDQPTFRGSDDPISTLFYVSRSILTAMRSTIYLLRHFNWTERVSFVSEDGSFFLSTTENVVGADINDNTVLTTGNESVPISVFLKLPREPKQSTAAIRTFFDDIRDNGTRVIVGLVSQRIAAKMICIGREGIIPGSGFLYVFVGAYTEDWWMAESEYCELTAEAVQSVIVVSGSIINPNSEAILESGNSIHDFKVNFTHKQSEWCDHTAHKADVVDPQAGLVYDAVWATALAMNQSMDAIDNAVRRGVQYDQDTLQAIISKLNTVNFSGITGNVRFGEGNRIGDEAVQQIQEGEMVIVGSLIEGGEYVAITDLWWNGSGNITPSDIAKEEEKGVPLYWLIISLFFTLSGVVFAVVMWVFNCHYSRHRILRASSQKLNYFIIVGVMFGYLTVLLLTVLESPLGPLLSDNVFKALCLIRIWTLPLAFTFTYGILLARAWRIYRVFNNPWASSRPYKDYHLMLIVLVLALVDVVILLPWTIVDPYRRFPIETEVDYDSFSRCIFASCSSTNVTIWLPVLSVYKILIIVLGINIVILVRKEVVARKIFDDTKSLALGIYITAVAFIVGAPLTVLFLFANQVVYSYIASALWVNISVSSTLVCVFMPKVHQIVVKKQSGKKYKAARRLYYGRQFTVQQSIDLNGSLGTTV